MPGLIDISPEPDALAGIHALLDSLTEAMPFLVSLSADEVKSLFKLGPQSEAFVMKTLAAAEQHGRLLPARTSVANMRRDAELRAALRPIRQRVATLLEMLDGTMLLAGADLMKSCSMVYKTLKIHSKGEGIDELIEDLGKRFAKRRNVAAGASKRIELGVGAKAYAASAEDAVPGSQPLRKATPAASPRTIPEAALYTRSAGEALPAGRTAPDSTGRLSAWLAPAPFPNQHPRREETDHPSPVLQRRRDARDCAAGAAAGGARDRQGGVADHQRRQLGSHHRGGA